MLLAEAGSKARHLAAPVLGRIVKEQFFGRLTQAQIAALQEIRSALDVTTPTKA